MFVFVTCNVHLGFVGLQMYFLSYANPIYDFFVSCTSRDRKPNADQLWRTATLIYVDNAQLAITAIDLNQ